MDIRHDTPASKVTNDDKAAFVMSFVDQSDRLREDLVDTWEESLSNYFVRPVGELGWRTRTDRPLLRADPNKGRLGYAELKDPESHQIVETLLAKVWTALFQENGSIQARGVGIEDAHKGVTATKLLEYDLNLYGHQRTLYEWLKDGFIFGTGVMEIGWHYEEGMHRIRSVGVDPFTMLERTREQILPVVLYDDPRMRPVNIMDFYPDPGECRLQWMRGAAKRFKIHAKEALRRGEWDKAAVLRAINNMAGDHDSEERYDHEWQEDIKYTDESQIPDDFEPLVGFEYWGEVPWKTEGDFKDRQVITLLCGEIVRDRMWPLFSNQLPFFDVTINPVEGRFYGLGPLEVEKYDQDFADLLKRMIANAVVRGTLAQPIVNGLSLTESSKLRRFHPDIPIVVRGDPRTAVNFLEYRPPVELAQNSHSLTKQAMREGTGALGAIQGLGLGSKRFSATEAATSFQQAFDRPEMIASLIEKDSLPPIGEHLMGLNRQFIETSEGLARRVGERPGNVALADILMNFDIVFVGSRKQHDRASRLQSLERFATAVGSIPMIATNVPWDLWLEQYIDALDLQMIRQAVAAPDTIEKNLILQQLLGQNAQNGNGQPTNPSQALTPQQDIGGVLGPAA